MNVFLTSVTTGKHKDRNDPKILFYAEWMRPMGFVPDALVQFIPEDGGASFVLCNENIPSYSELFQRTKEKSGVLIHAKLFAHRDFPCLGVSGAILRRAGLVLGDSLIARYEYGFIHMRKLPPGNVKLVNSRIFGNWLIEYGFDIGAVLTASSEPGLISCTLHENGLERTAELVKFARANKLSLLQVQRVNDHQYIYPRIEIPPSRMEKAGFSSDDLLLASYEYGQLQLRKLDFKALGF